jgi:hypothetical protein
MQSACAEEDSMRLLNFVALAGWTIAGCSAGPTPPIGSPSTPGAPSQDSHAAVCSGGVYAHNLHFAAAARLGDAAIPDGSAANDLVLAPLHGGALDLAVLLRKPDPGGGAIAVFRNDGAGHFRFESSLDLGDAMPYRGVAMDVNADGIVDLAAYGVSPSGQVSLVIALRTRDGFAAPRTFAVTGAPLEGFQNIATPLFAGPPGSDGLPTLALAVTDPQAQNPSTYIRLFGASGASTSLVLAGEARDAIGADFDADGLDYATVDDGNVHLFDRTGRAMVSWELVQNDDPTQILAADFNHDGNLDVRTLQESCYDTYNPTPMVPPPAGSDGSNGGPDGHPVFDGPNGPVAYHLNLDPTTREGFGDLNGDGRPELVIGGTDGKLAILLLKPDGTVDTEIDTDDGSMKVPLDFGRNLTDLSLAVGDLDGDGIADVVVGQRASFGTNLAAEGNTALLNLLISDGCGPVQPN